MHVMDPRAPPDSLWTRLFVCRSRGIAATIWGMMPFIAPETSARTTLRVASALAAASEAAATLAVSLRPPHMDTQLQMVPDTSIWTANIGIQCGLQLRDRIVKINQVQLQAPDRRPQIVWWAPE